MLELHDHPKTVLMSGQTAIASMTVNLTEGILPHLRGRMYFTENGGTVEVLSASETEDQTNNP